MITSISQSTDSESPLDAPVVVGVDDSPEGVAAARYGVQAAALSGREVWLFHAYDQASSGLAPASAAKRLGRERAEQLLRRTAGEVVVPSNVQLRLRTSERPADQALREVAQRAALVVLGQDHLVHSGRLSVGQLARRLTHEGSCPVAVVPAHWSPAAAAAPVVLAIDVDTPERRLIQTAFAEAEVRRTGLVIEYAEPRPERVQAAEIALHEMLAGDRADRPDVHVEIRVTAGRPADTFVNWSRGAAVLVLGRPHQLPWSRWLVTLVERAIAHAKCPVLVVPPALAS